MPVSSCSRVVRFFFLVTTTTRTVVVLLLIAFLQEQFHVIQCLVVQQQQQPQSETMVRASAAQRYEQFRKHPALFRGSPFNQSWVHPDLQKLVDIFKQESAKDQEAAVTTMTSIPNSSTGDDDADPQICSTTKTNDDDDDAAVVAVPIPKSAIPLLRKESPGVYSFNCFDASFIRMFNEEIQHFYMTAEEENIPIRRPNSMNNYGVIVNEIGMRPMITAFQQQYIWPLSRVLFPKQGTQFDDHHAFIVRYQSGQDLGLDMHVDDSDVTFNVCMGDVFTGATLSFCGMFGAPNHRKLVHVYQHQVGRAILHLGNRRHGADDIQTGTRSNLIIWNHNYQWRNGEEYKRRRQFDVYEKEEGPPDPTCVSYTHDRDYFHYKDTIPTSQQNQSFKGWCPPPGKEYDGFPGNS